MSVTNRSSKLVCSKSDGLPILDHDMMRIYVINEQKYLIIVETLRRLLKAIKNKELVTVKAILSRHRRGALFPWQNDNWPSETEQKDLVVTHVINPHYRLYRNEMASRYLARRPEVVKLEAVFASLIKAIEERDSKRVWKMVNKWAK